MKKILIIIMVLALLVGCTKNDKSMNLNGGAVDKENESTKNVNLSQDNTDEQAKEESNLEDISVKSTITFPSKDGLVITADTYIIDDTSDFMVLYHQAEWSRGEYNKTALKFNALGYNVMAVDLRSGLEVNNVVNETAKRAIEGDYPMSGEDSGMDVQASIEYVRDEFECDSIYILGSSYSGALVLVVAPEYGDLIKGVLTFSPGISLMWNDKKVAENVVDLKVPVFLSSNKSEVYKNEFLMPNISSEIKVLHDPEGRGRHGASVLWDSVKDSDEYWEALTAFLNDINQ